MTAIGNQVNVEIILAPDREIHLESGALLLWIENERSRVRIQNCPTKYIDQREGRSLMSVTPTLLTAAATASKSSICLTKKPRDMEEFRRGHRMPIMYG